MDIIKHNAMLQPSAQSQGVSRRLNITLLKGNPKLQIRIATEADFEDIWPIFEEVAAAGDTYAYPRETTKDEAKRLWVRLLWNDAVSL